MQKLRSRNCFIDAENHHHALYQRFILYRNIGMLRRRICNGSCLPLLRPPTLLINANVYRNVEIAYKLIVDSCGRAMFP